MRLRRETLFEELWGRRSPATDPIERELLRLETLNPGAAEDLESLFKEAVYDSLSRTLGCNEARALVILAGGPDFESPTKVFQALESILHEGSKILRDAIEEEFRARVDLFLAEAIDRSLKARQFQATQISR